MVQNLKGNMAVNLLSLANKELSVNKQTASVVTIMNKYSKQMLA